MTERLTDERAEAIRRGWIDANYSASPTDMHVPTLKADLTALLADRDRLVDRLTQTTKALERIADYGCGCAGCQIARAALVSGGATTR